MRSDSAAYLLTGYRSTIRMSYALRYFIVKSMAWCLCCKLICYLSIIYGNGDGDSCRDRGGDGDY